MNTSDHTADHIADRSAEPDTTHAHGDKISDPAHNDRIGHDWADEGGATPDGPATHADADHVHPAHTEPDPQ